jgi:hypothetical protein
MKQRGAEVEDLLLGLVEVKDVEVQMELLRVRGVRPLRCPVRGSAKSLKGDAGLDGMPVMSR